MRTIEATERPILMSSPMVRAILEDRKTQTRRVVKVGSVLSAGQKEVGFEWCDDPDRWRCDYPIANFPRIHIPVRHPDDKLTSWDDCGCNTFESPYEVGMRLWVRETFRLWDHDFETVEVEYLAGGASQYEQMERRDKPNNLHQRGSDGLKLKRPSIFMPRWASRLTLEIVSVRGERLQEMTEEDAEAEGADFWFDEQHLDHPERPSSVCAFSRLWDSINGKTFPWASNPWVWVIGFRRV